MSPNKLHGELTGAKWVQFRRSRDSYPSTLEYDLRKMFNNPIGHDIILKVDTAPPSIPLIVPNPGASLTASKAGDPSIPSVPDQLGDEQELIYAHKIFLTQRCTVFEAMLKPGTHIMRNNQSVLNGLLTHLFA